jgi:hypothetical protein
MLLAVTASTLLPADTPGAIAAVRRAGPDGRGSAEAARAWRELAAADVRELPALLGGMDGASAVARNWLRAAVDPVVARAEADKTPLPAKELEAFLADTRHDAQARRLAYELVCRQDKTSPDRLLPGMLDDPSPDLRRDAVARVLDEAGKAFDGGRKTEALSLYGKALAAAREKAQIDQAAQRLDKLGHPVDLATHLGMVLDWKVIGPFPNPDTKGIDTPYAPEKAVDFSATCKGKSGTVRWVDCTSTSEYGLVDVHSALAPFAVKKGEGFERAVAYAATEFTSAAARDVEVRLGCYAAFKLWVNGELALVRGDAFTGMKLDHYVAYAKLKRGKNVILLKLSQDEVPPPMPKVCRFQLRVCDASGAAILSTTRPPAAPKKPS